MGYGAIQVLSGITLLSELGIDIDKDWQAYPIHNLEDPTEDQDAATKAYVDALVGNYLFNTQEDVAASRTMNLVYQNKNAFPIMVVVTVQIGILGWEDGFPLTGYSQVEALCQDINPPTKVVAEAYVDDDQDGSPTTTTTNWYIPISFIVPAGYYYKLAEDYVTRGEHPSEIAWIEYGGTGELP